MIMLCERCNKKKATVFYHENIDGKSRAFRLCGECTTAMQQTGELEELSSAFARFPLPFSVLEDGGFDGLFPLPKGRKGSASASKTCPLCGMTYGEIATTGKVGCAACYRTFSLELAHPIRVAHGATAYAGQAPRQLRLRREREKLLTELRDQLTRAVAEENYEEAASLRDRIRAADAET